MNKINLEFTSQQAEVLIPFFNNAFSFIFEWAELTECEVDDKEARFLSDSIILLRDGSVMNLDVVLEVRKEIKNILLRLSANIALIREKVSTPKEYDLYDDIISIITEGYKKFFMEV